MEKIVTKDWLQRRLYCKCKTCNGGGELTSFDGVSFPQRCENCRGNGIVKARDYVNTLGRALVAIYNNQTDAEKANFATKNKNGRGFTGPDARLGTRAAKEFIATGTLPEWLAKVWLVEKAGYPRICKYAGQLNKIANGKRTVLQGS